MTSPRTSPRRLVHLALLLGACTLLGACASSPSGSLHGGSQTAASDDANLAATLDQVLGRGATGQAFYVARVVDPETGRELYAVDPDRPVMPASNGKIAVGAATLDFFGSKHTFKTYLAVDGDDLWLIGTGDPGTGDNTIARKYGGTTMTVLDDFAAALKKRGITHLKGNLYFYDRADEAQIVNPTWSKGYLTDWYAAPISGLNFNNNCIDITVRPTSDGEPVRYSVTPPTTHVGVTINNRCVTGKGDAPDVDRELDSNDFTITGAVTKKTSLKSEAIKDPGPFFADALRTHLAEKGITLDGQTKRADTPLGGHLEPPPDKVVAVHETKLVDALSRINKQSQNNFAEGFDKLLGRAYAQKQGRDEPGSWANGEQAVKAFLTKNGISTAGIRLVDGSGLSRQDRVTARMISDVLVTMWKHPEHRAYFDSLTIAGVDGTIGSRLKDLKGRVHAKTGYIGGVRSLSGYVKNDAGRWLVFSIIYNGIRGSVKPFEQRQDNACRVLAAWPKPAKLPAATQPIADAR
jgi:D-alanyl-D-alanine carboxypeptidase/D-alanyl-D-alanine-endopeptidase (penicillin-binding protein 4)